jgi:hypothetical protein
MSSAHALAKPALGETRAVRLTRFAAILDGPSRLCRFKIYRAGAIFLWPPNSSESAPRAVGEDFFRHRGEALRQARRVQFASTGSLRKHAMFGPFSLWTPSSSGSIRALVVVCVLYAICRALALCSNSKAPWMLASARKAWSCRRPRLFGEGAARVRRFPPPTAIEGFRRRKIPRIVAWMGAGGRPAI